MYKKINYVSDYHLPSTPINSLNEWVTLGYRHGYRLVELLIGSAGCYM